MRPSYLIASLTTASVAAAGAWLYFGNSQPVPPPVVVKAPEPAPVIEPEPEPTPEEPPRLVGSPARVTHVEGNVRYRAGRKGAFKPLTVGTRLMTGATVITGPNSFAGYRLRDGTLLSQIESSKLTFDELGRYEKTRMMSTKLKLESGRLEAQVTRQVKPDGQFNVVTPVAVAGLRGTAFRLNVSEDGKTLRSEVINGKVAIISKGREVNVSGGQGNVTLNGKAPQAVKPLPPAPALADLPKVIESTNLDFAWSTSPEADKWRAQVSTDPQFNKIVLDDVFGKPEASWKTNLPDGNYILRVRSIDPTGVEGFNADHPFTVDVHPLPPTPSSPKAASRSYSQNIQFSWAPAHEAKGYVLQVASAADFSTGLIERKVDAQTALSENLKPGNYYWRLASVDDKGKNRGWSKPVSLTVQPLASAPSGQAQAKNDAILLDWKPVAGASQYEIQIDNTPSMKSPVAQPKVAQNSHTEKLDPGKYYWRIRTIEADGQAGTFSQTQTVVLPPAAPSIKAIITGGRIQVSLASKGAVNGYEVELATDPEFKNVVDKGLGTSPIIMRHPGGGSYYLRARAIGSESIPSAYSATESVANRGLLN